MNSQPSVTSVDKVKDNDIKIHKIGIKLRGLYYVCMLMFGGQKRNPTSLINVDALCVTTGEKIRFEVNSKILDNIDGENIDYYLNIDLKETLSKALDLKYHNEKFNNSLEIICSRTPRGESQPINEDHPKTDDCTSHQLHVTMGKTSRSDSKSLLALKLNRKKIDLLSSQLDNENLKSHVAHSPVHLKKSKFAISLHASLSVTLKDPHTDSISPMAFNTIDQNIKNPLPSKNSKLHELKLPRDKTKSIERSTLVVERKEEGKFDERKKEVDIYLPKDKQSLNKYSHRSLSLPML